MSKPNATFENFTIKSQRQVTKTNNQIPKQNPFKKPTHL